MRFTRSRPKPDRVGHRAGRRGRLPLRSGDLDVEFGGGGFQTLKGSPVSGSIAIGLVAAAIVLLLAFGSVPSMLIPLIAAIVSVASGIEVVGLLSHRSPSTRSPPAWPP